MVLAHSLAGEQHLVTEQLVQFVCTILIVTEHHFIGTMLVRYLKLLPTPFMLTFWIYFAATSRVSLAKALVLYHFVWFRLDIELRGFLGKLIDGFVIAVKEVMIYGLLPFVEGIFRFRFINAAHFLHIIESHSALTLYLSETRRI